MKRTVLFGAGAAAAFYQPRLTTEAVTTHLQNPDAWRQIVDRYNRLQDGYSVDVAEVLGTIHRILAVNPFMNFEQLIETVDKVASFNMSAGGADHLALHDLLRYFGVKPTVSATPWVDVPFLARQLIAEFVLNATTGDDQATLRANQSVFIQKLLDSGPVSLYSLNYDESLCWSTDSLGIASGFSETGHFNEYNFFSARSVVAFPHGHIRYKTGSYGEIVCDGDASRACRERFDRLATVRDQTLTAREHHFAYVFDTFIITGQTKDHALSVNPFAAAYQRLAADLISSDQLIVIGYGFGDPHINRRTVNFLNQNRSTKRLLIVDLNPGPVDTLADVDPTGDRNSGAWSLRRLREIGVRNVDLSATDPLTYRYQPGIDTLNERGYGTLVPKVTLAKDGYASFLRDHEAILASMHD